MKLTPSYISYILPLLVLINIQIASLLYPYVFTCSFIGIVAILITFLSTDVNNIIRYYFPDLISYQFESNLQLYYLINILVILYKFALIYYYPYNFSLKSLLSSTLLFLIYLIYLINYVLKN